MGFFNLRPKTLTDDELRDALFNAVAESNASALRDLLTKHGQRVTALFPAWTTLPISVRSDPARMKWWAAGTIGVASAMAARGDGALMARLSGRLKRTSSLHGGRRSLLRRRTRPVGSYRRPSEDSKRSS